MSRANASRPGSREAGKSLYGGTGCRACHGDDLRGGKVLEDAKGYPVVSRDLTAPWTFRGGSGLYKYKSTRAGAPPSDDDL